MIEIPVYYQQKSFKTGVLVVNLGTPDAPTARAVRGFLKEFLWDKRVVSIPRPIWWLILHGLILTRRPKPVAKNYQMVWLKEGSPLLVYSQRLVEKLQATNSELMILLAMRYGKPSIAAAMDRFQQENVRRILVIPLYPQYSTTTTASVFDALLPMAAQWPYLPEIRWVNDYHEFQPMIDAVADSIQQAFKEKGRPDKLLFSFHGLPERLLRLGDPYYVQCQITADRIVSKLGLTTDEYQVSFQSRFGKETWLQPYTNQTLTRWAEQGIKSVSVCCPGFPVDCLETLEEIAVLNRDTFMAAGGARFHYIPALNHSDAHVGVMAALIKRYTSDWEATFDPDEWHRIYHQYR